MTPTSNTRPPEIGAGGSLAGLAAADVRQEKLLYRFLTKRPSQFTSWWPRSLTLGHGIPGRVPNWVANLLERELKSASLFVRSLMK